MKYFATYKCKQEKNEQLVAVALWSTQDKFNVMTKTDAMHIGLANIRRISGDSEEEEEEERESYGLIF